LEILALSCQHPVVFPGPKLLAPILALLLGSPCISAAEPDSPQRRLEQAIALSDRRAYDDSLAILQPLLPVVEKGNDDALRARVLFFTARAHYFKSDYRTALPLLERALAASREARDPAFEATVLRATGRLHKQQGTYPEGLRILDEAIALYVKLGQPREEAGAWLTIGAIHDLTGNFEQALTAYGRARLGLQTVKDADYYTLFNEIGITYTNLGRYEEALASHHTSLEGRLKLGDKYYIGISHSNLGDVYYALGQYERAAEHYEQCVNLCGVAGDRRAVAVVLGALAMTWMASGNAQRGLEYSRRGLDLTRESGLEHLEGVALRRVGYAYEQLGNVAESMAHQERALELARKAGAQLDEAATLNALTGLHLQRGEPEKAAPLAKRALQLALATGSPDLEVEARVNLARVARAEKDSATALDHLRKSVAILDGVRGRVRTDSGKIGYFDTRQDVYHQLAQTLLEKGSATEALEAAEAARGRAFSDLLAGQRVQLGAKAATSLEEIRALEARIRAENAQTSDEVQQVRVAQTRAATESQLRGRLSALRSEQPELASLVTAEPLATREITAIAARLRATLVEYLVTERELLIWTIQPDGKIAATHVDVSRQALRDKARAVQDRMNSLTAKELDRDPVIRAHLEALYRTVLAPIAGQLPRNPTALVYIVPHDALHLVPFAALIDKNGRYAVENHTLVYAPSVAVLRYTDAKKRRVVSAPSPHLLALADPTPPKDIPEGALPGARNEIQQIGRRFPEDRRLTLLGDEASEANAKRLSPGQTVLHFAVHGLVRDDRPWESALILAPGEGEDGWLKVPEIFGLDLRADLVALSGCSTGAGRVSGDGIVGLARAVIYAGAPSVLVSQWDVSDVTTSYLMDHFYGGLAAGHGKARSLRDAQLATLKRYPHPMLWAAFVLVGEPQ
jgi:CHAT domain-containing protein/tetratricopeptide (TPR) repeat protein